MKMRSMQIEHAAGELRAMSIEAEGAGVGPALAAVGQFLARGMNAQAAVDVAIKNARLTSQAVISRSAQAAAFERQQLRIPGSGPEPSPAAPKASRRRLARFKVAGRFDGAEGATITVTQDLIMVRPRGRRRMYTLPLEAVARGVIFEVVMGERKAKRGAKKKGGRA